MDLSSTVDNSVRRRDVAMITLAWRGGEGRRKPRMQSDLRTSHFAHCITVSMHSALHNCCANKPAGFRRYHWYISTACIARPASVSFMKKRGQTLCMQSLASCGVSIGASQVIFPLAGHLLPPLAPARETASGLFHGAGTRKYKLYPISLSLQRCSRW